MSEFDIALLTMLIVLIVIAFVFWQYRKVDEKLDEQPSTRVDPETPAPVEPGATGTTTPIELTTPVHSASRTPRELGRR